MQRDACSPCRDESGKPYEIGWCSPAQKEPKLPKVAVRWLQRYLKEQEARLDDVALAVSALSALAGEHRAEAGRVLRALAGSF